MSGGLNPVNLVSQAALAIATGGTSLIGQLAMQIAGQIVNQVIQQVGQQLGLPQPIIDAAQGVAAGATGNYAAAREEFTQAASGFGSLAQTIDHAGEALGASPAEVGDLHRQATDAVETLQQAVFKGMVDGESNGDGARASGKGKKGGESFLMALARVLGQALDNKLEEQMGAAKKLDKMNEKGGEKSHIGEQTAKVQALGQEVGMISAALQNSLKTIGEAASTLARKG